MPTIRSNRRTSALRNSLALIAWLAAPCVPCAAEPLLVEVRETAGIARFGYPVTGRFNGPDDPQAPFRLLRDGRPVAAQFSRVGEQGPASLWEVDFNVDLGPFESRQLSIENVAAAELPTPQALTVARDADKLRVLRPGLEFVLPENSFDLLHSVKSPQEDYLLPNSPGLFVRDREGNTLRFAPSGTAAASEMQIVKAGPLCAALQFEGAEEASAGGRARLQVRLDFPRSKSWVRVECEVKDGKRQIAALGADFHLRLSPTKARPVIVDFGAPSSVYTALAPAQRAVFRGSPRVGTNGAEDRVARAAPWDVTRGVEGKMAPYVVGLADDARPVEGWAHVMDEQVCTAVAVDRFGQDGVDRIEIAADGRLRLWREFGEGGAAKPDQPKTFVFWLHFVPSPPQIGAVTSPQSMQSPPAVRIRPR
ncbi:MAG TPA: hypothetical protein VN699_11160 [Pirellulales bacterium]|nr:hypothetical protein [Pirellulales bacterium]